MNAGEDKENSEPLTQGFVEDSSIVVSRTHVSHADPRDGKLTHDPHNAVHSERSFEDSTKLTQGPGLFTATSRSSSDASRALKLSPQQIKDLTSSPGSIPLRVATPINEALPTLAEESVPADADYMNGHVPSHRDDGKHTAPPDVASVKLTPGAVEQRGRAARSISSPVLQRKQSTQGTKARPQLPHLKLEGTGYQSNAPETSGKIPSTSPMPVDLPIPPLSLPTYLQLELSTSRPSPLYIHHDPAVDIPYESSQVVFDRLLNFLHLPPQLEQVLLFGTLACLDSWLYTFTILPLRFFNATVILMQWFASNVTKELNDLSSIVYSGLGRVWQRHRQSSYSSRRPSVAEGSLSRRPSAGSRKNSAVSPHPRSAQSTSEKRRTGFRHRRTRSTPSTLMPNHKADLLQGLLIVFTCIALLWLDASRMYHSIRGQAAIKLYVIYNVLEVFDKLFAALGQDVLLCLFSKESLERGADGRSKVIRPLGMFLLALLYNMIHATALFYQLVTLNVAVNSYSNALLTLLMSNQFVEIKSTVFKKFEKENLFQMTCADIVERIQLWIMLMIIGLRNIVEMGGLNTASGLNSPSPTAAPTANATSQPSMGVIPNAFTLLPAWTGEVIGPFLIVLGSEMLVDWLKHAYIAKFNNVKPNLYGRFLDVLAKDYYSHAFADQNLTKRLGLPVIPLSCLFIRASVQTYHMFLAIHVPPVVSAATAVSLETEAVTTPATIKALQHIDLIFRGALGRSSFGAGLSEGSWTVDDVIALATMAMFFLALYLLLLAFKLVLGMVLLTYSRNRFKSMKKREQPSDAKGRRLGGWGVVELEDAKRKWIYEDDKDGLNDLLAKQAKAKVKAEKTELSLDHIERYMMVAKKIW